MKSSKEQNATEASRNIVEVREIELKKITRSEDIQIRANLSKEVFSAYAESMLAGEDFPPVTVFQHGDEFVLADGFHRFMAAECSGHAAIQAEVRNGDRVEALKFALQANTRHGLRRSNADKRRAVSLALTAFPNLSDRGIAELCAVTADLVGAVRQVSTVDTCAKRTGRDGKNYPTQKNMRQEAVVASSVAASSDTEPTSVDSAQSEARFNVSLKGILTNLLALANRYPGKLSIIAEKLRDVASGIERLGGVK
jgi:hypothetical protein